MRGNVPPGEYIDTLLNVASNQELSRAMQALSIPLGYDRRSSQMTSNESWDILEEGNENIRTQSLVRSLTPEHMDKMRELYDRKEQPLFADKAYLLSLYHKPQLADTEDTELLCREFKGLKPTRLFKPKEGIPAYNPENIFEIITTAQKVFKERPDLLNADTIKSIRGLPNMKDDDTDFTIRPAFDSDIMEKRMGELRAMVDELRKMGNRVGHSSGVAKEQVPFDQELGVKTKASQH